MRYLGVLLGVVLLAALQASAQINSSGVQLADSPFAFAPASAPAAAEPPAALNSPSLPDEPPLELAPLPLVASPSPEATPFPAGPPPQGVYGVFQNFRMEAYGGYTFFRFYEVPNNTETMSGLNASLQYFFKDWLAADGEGFLTFGSFSSPWKSFAFAGAGPRVRRSGPRGTELWAHALIGYAHDTPQTVFGSEGAFAYMFGGGVDISARSRRIAYRVSVDMVGSRFFSTYQYSPKVSVGLVYKF